MRAAASRTGSCTCAGCVYLIHDPVEFERALPGILILSSGQGESRGDQGLCQIHRRLVTPEMTCRYFQLRAPGGEIEPTRSPPR
jgi:hypothetical protein